MYLAVATNVEDVTPLSDPEFARLDELRAVGVLVVAWVRADSPWAARAQLHPRGIGTSDLATLPSVAGATILVRTPVADLESVRPVRRLRCSARVR